MQLQQPEKNPTLSLYFKSAAIIFLLFLSILVIACSNNSGSQVDLGTPVATITISLGQVIGSPTPPLKDYYCGGWATDTTPQYNPKSVVNVYGKFTHNVGGNPEGVGGATATATILWPDNTPDTMTVTTTTDGLAVFAIPIKPSALNKEVLIQITFTTAQGITCTIPQAAYFVAILGSGTPTKTAVPSPTKAVTPPSVTPTGSPTRIGTPTATPSPTPTKKPG
jgi:hypothetical protein